MIYNLIYLYAAAGAGTVCFQDGLSLSEWRGGCRGCIRGSVAYGAVFTKPASPERPADGSVWIQYLKNINDYNSICIE